MIRSVRFHLVLTLAALCFGAAPALSVDAEADSYVQSTTPTQNFGAQTVLNASSGTRETFLRFPVAADGPVTNATLRVFATTASSGSVSVGSVGSDSWIETAINWNTRPTATNIGTIAGPVAANSWQTFDVTDWVNTQTDGKASFRITTAATTTLGFASREAAIANRPQLIITRDRKYGYSAHMSRNVDIDNYTSMASGGGAKTIRDDFVWADIEATQGVYNWAGPDKLMVQAAKNRMSLLITVGTTPTWARLAPPAVPLQNGEAQWLPPTTAGIVSFGTFARKIAERYKAGGAFWTANPTLPQVYPAGIEIWNEPNSARFWGGLLPDPTWYAKMLKSAYQSIKLGDPNMPVITGGLQPVGSYTSAGCNTTNDGGFDQVNGNMNGLRFLESVYNFESKTGRLYFDAVGHHPYNFNDLNTAEQALAFHACSAWSQMTATTPSIRSIMIGRGDTAKKVWATETGAPTCVTGRTYSKCLTESEQGRLATQELALWKSFVWSGNCYWYDLRDDGTSLSNSEDHFGVVRRDDTPKPAYTALRNGFMPQLLTGPTAVADVMHTGEILGAGDSLRSPDGRFALYYQYDGNLVLYGFGRTLWASGTSGSVGVATLRSDGNLVIVPPGGVSSWTSPATNPLGGSTMYLQNDGNLVIYRPAPTGGASWATGVPTP